MTRDAGIIYFLNNEVVIIFVFVNYDIISHEDLTRFPIEISSSDKKTPQIY